MCKYKISVIIPVYNVSRYIENAFNSLLNQSIGFENLQIIFVDDASTDNSDRIIKDYSDRYDNVISIFLDKNSGYAGRPRNVGMDYATADYLMFLDPDDVYLTTACELLYNEISSNNLDIVSGVHCDGKEVPKHLWSNILTDSTDSFNGQVNEIVKDSSFELEVASIDEYPSIIAAANVWDKIFKRSLIENNEITFPEEIPGEDSVFLLNAFLNANGIKFINKIVVKHEYGRSDSVQHQFSKTKIIKRLKAYYLMFYLCLEKNKTDIFKQYLLYIKLHYVLSRHIMESDLSTGDLLEILKYAKPLYKLYVDYCNSITDDLAVFEDIASGRYEEVIKFIHGSNTPNFRDITCVVYANFLVKDCVELSDEWQSQFESIKPDLFAYQDKNDEILDYCNANNIQTVQLDGDIIDLNEILDSVNFKYIPDLKHIVLFYELENLADLTDIQNHFYSIKYPYKHLKLITDESNLFLSNTILESDLQDIDLQDNYYYCFADLNLNPEKLWDNVLSKSEFKKSISNHYVFPKISVIVPVYNTEYYLEEALDSIVNQTFFDNIEVILIDDGSTDRSKEIIEKYVSEYDNVRGYYKDHVGVCAIRNFGIYVARGEYIHLMDSDDFILHDSYEKLYRCTQNGKYDVVTSNYVRWEDDNTWEIHIGEHIFNKSRRNIENTNLADYPELSWDMPLWNKIIKKEFLDENNIRFEDKCTIYSDNPFTIEVYIKAKNVYVLNDVAYCWRKRKVGTSITQSTDLQMPKSFYEMAKTVNDKLTENVCDKRVLNDKYQKLLKIDLFILINKIILNYPPESQDELFEVALDVLNLVPDEYLNNSTSFFKMLYSIVKARDWDNLRLFTDFGMQFHLNLPESLDKKYVEMIDTKNDPLENRLEYTVNDVYLDENNVVFNFPRIVPDEDADYYEKINFRMVCDDFEDVIFDVADNKLTIPLNIINFGENRLIIDYLFNSIKQSTHIKTNLKKTFIFDDFKILVDYDITKDLKLFKYPLNKSSMIINDVIFLNNKLRFTGQVNGSLNEITFKDYLNCAGITAGINHQKGNDFLFEIDYSEFLKAPVKKWEIDAKFSNEFDCLYDKYRILIRNGNGNGTIIFEQVHETYNSNNEIKKLETDKISLHKKQKQYTKSEIIKKIINKDYSNLTIAIKSPHLKGTTDWGDLFFSKALKKSFEKLGFNVIIQERESWYEGNDEIDIAFVLRGLADYNVDNSNINLMWNISHPERVSKEEYEKYDYVFISSEKYANKLANQVNTNVASLLQCTDPEVFYREMDNDISDEILFVGITRGVYREIVKDVLKTNHEVSVYGKEWEEFIDEKYIKGQFIPNEELHKYYSSCKILLNDHWKDMKDEDFPSNRLFDALACGTFVISDKIPSAETLFEGSIVTYDGVDDLNEKIEYYLNHEEERKKLAQKGQKIVLKNHTFDKRVEEILAALKDLNF